MSAHELIESARSGDLERARSLVAAGADIETRDEDSWTALCWAAGAGHDAIVVFLLESGANPFAADKDRRTPYMIALAANHVITAKRLAEAEAASGGDGGRPAARRPYCCAYTVGELRQFSGWGQEQKNPPPGDTVVFLHADFSVTRTIWPREETLFDDPSPEWRRFCVERLNFQPPVDLE
jgi:uncharacterized protein